MSQERLLALYAEIDARSKEVSSKRAEWPCRRGCHACCSKLAGPPVFTQLEWEELWRGFVKLAPDVQAQVRARVDALDTAIRSEHPPEHVSCPLLEPSSGACLVYAHRPALCRGYGMYASRDSGNWCEQIEREIVPTAQDIVWGNQDAVDRKLESFAGEPVDIKGWFDTH